MKKCILWFDLTMSILTAIVLSGVLLSFVACKAGDFEKHVLEADSTVQKVAEIAVAAGPALTPVLMTVPGSVWAVLLINIASSIGSAIVAVRKNVTP